MSDIVWKVNDIVFSETKQTLLFDKNTVVLEPRQSEVLAYFCQHPHQLVSRDELLDKVWQGQIVTDNAVNRVIAKLRKSLGDDAKNTEFIQTLPRKGYKFIATVSVYEPQDTALINIKKPAMVLTTTLLLAALIWHLIPSTSNQTMIKSAIALTRGSGEEDGASISPNEKFLSYRAVDKGFRKLYLKNIESGETIQISDDLGNATAASWSKDSHQLIYFYNNSNVCQIRLVTLKDGIVNRKNTVHNCPVGNRGNVAFNHDEQQIIYSEKHVGDKPYYVYVKHLENGSIRKLNQPPTFNAGHVTFDLHPTKQKLLVSTPDEQQWHAFYLLDLQTDHVELLFKKDDYICCAIFNQNGEKIVVMGSHPAYSLVEMDMNGKNVRTIYRSTHRVGPPKRVSDTMDYVYSGGHFNFDIDFYAFDDAQYKPIANSSVADKLPTANTDGTLLAYLSRVTGASQLWLAEPTTGKQSRLTTFTDHRMYQDLKLSPDGQHLSALMKYGIKLINVNNGEFRLLKMPQQVARGISWVDEQTIAYSIEIEGQWRVHHYNINTDKVSAIDKQWAYIHYATKAEETVYINHQSELFINQHRLETTPFSAIDYYGMFYFQVFDGGLYYRPRAPKSWDIYRLDLTTLTEQKLVTVNRPGAFSVTSQGIYFTHLKDFSGDIFRTRQ